MLLAHYVSDVVAGLMLGVAIDKLVGRLFNSVRATLIAKL
jgi:membrane-associated phospholipid phosphatase